MAIQFSWRFPKLHCYTNFCGKQDVVYAVSWEYAADDGSGNVCIITGERDVKAYEDGGDFVPLSELTHAIVSSWMPDCFPEHEISGMQEYLALAVSEKANPTKVVYNVNL